MGERSFAEDVKQLGYGAGDLLHGEGILAITKALLQSGVSYVGGYPGAPVSYLIDVLADANEPLLQPLGIYFGQSPSHIRCGARSPVSRSSARTWRRTPSRTSRRPGSSAAPSSSSARTTARARPSSRSGPTRPR